MYDRGEGVPQNKTKAEALFRKGAFLGSEQAQYALQHFGEN